MSRDWICILCAFALTAASSAGCDDSDKDQKGGGDIVIPDPDPDPDPTPDPEPEPTPDPEPEPEPVPDPEPTPDPDPEPGRYEVVEPATLVTSESGTSLRASIALSRAPNGTITITLTSSDETEGIAEPGALTFDADNWNTAQYFSIAGQPDGFYDGDVAYTVTGTAQSSDGDFASGTVFSWTIVNENIDPDILIADGTRIRLMTANITSQGDGYDPDAGRNIFKAVKPDIAMIQEFNVSKQTYEEFVAEVFGPDFFWFRGTTTPAATSKGIPNGIVSRYPILSSGEWRAKNRKTTATGSYDTDTTYSDRQWTWAVIDIPGDRDLLAVSVHLHTQNNRYEYEPLAEKIAAKQQEGGYYVAIGGDFNAKDENYTELTTKAEAFRSIFELNLSKSPVDQNGNSKTNAKRAARLDWLLFGKDLDALAIPTEIGFHTGSKAYPNGHVFDTRVYAKYCDENGVSEITAVPPCSAGDSGDKEMQHMAVIRDIAIPDE